MLVMVCTSLVTVHLGYSWFRIRARVGLGPLGILCEAHPQLQYRVLIWSHKCETRTWVITEVHSHLQYECEAHSHLSYHCEAHSHLWVWGALTVTLAIGCEVHSHLWVWGSPTFTLRVVRLTHTWVTTVRLTHIYTMNCKAHSHLHYECEVHSQLSIWND